ncbi:hypothetical protein NP493_705g01005 [Ridgeia piscesae]|uniref:Uncharacterized protein n=1 Tax=Ridgeia piscesae TaxID=27915 RepID=A0AAD9NMU2_RIDPI|nr:hypothetical protein NP493_705g01005 [Ridgeia piscesae]
MHQYRQRVQGVERSSIVDENVAVFCLAAKACGFGVLALRSMELGINIESFPDVLVSRQVDGTSAAIQGKYTRFLLTSYNCPLVLAVWPTRQTCVVYVFIIDNVTCSIDQTSPILQHNVFHQQCTQQCTT